MNTVTIFTIHNSMTESNHLQYILFVYKKLIFKVESCDTLLEIEIMYLKPSSAFFKSSLWFLNLFEQKFTPMSIILFFS